MTLASLREQLLGARVVRLEGADGAGGARLTEIVFHEGTILRFCWSAGVADEVGLRIERARPIPGGIGRRRPVGAK